MTASNARRGRPNILLIAIDSLRRDHMSGYGYHRLTTPHIDRFAQDATLFEQTYSAHIPTTPAYASMLTGRDCFGTEVVALRHQGGLTEKVTTLPEVLREHGYNTLCVGFSGNPASRGFDRYLNYPAWGGDRARGEARKAQRLNDVTQPEIERLTQEPEPWFILLRHMDPHSPYLPPSPFNRLFYHGDECDPRSTSMEPVFAFKPFADYFRSWMPEGVTDRHYMDAQYDGAVAYMDACIAALFRQLETLGILDDTIVVINADHGETLYEHECWYDHHGLYDPTLVVPLIIRYPRRLPRGARVTGFNQHKDLMPTLLQLARIRTDLRFDGQSLLRLVQGRQTSFESELYITECTWMRKHGWRTSQWKLIEALEPDFHTMPPVELYNLIEDPLEEHNIADRNPEVVEALRARMAAYIAKRERQTGTTNPMLTQGDWHGHEGIGAFASSEQAYNTLHIGDASTARRLQAESRK